MKLKPKTFTVEGYRQLKGELQRQNKLILAKSLLKIMQNETKIVKIRQVVLEIFNLKDLDLDSLLRKKD